MTQRVFAVGLHLHTSKRGLGNLGASHQGPLFRPLDDSFARLQGITVFKRMYYDFTKLIKFGHRESRCLPSTSKHPTSSYTAPSSVDSQRPVTSVAVSPSTDDLKYWTVSSKYSCWVQSETNRLYVHYEELVAPILCIGKRCSLGRRWGPFSAFSTSQPAVGEATRTTQLVVNVSRFLAHALRTSVFRSSACLSVRRMCMLTYVPFLTAAIPGSSRVR